jgi:thiol-disulfide isomerase/thioredoxin
LHRRTVLAGALASLAAPAAAAPLFDGKLAQNRFAGFFRPASGVEPPGDVALLDRAGRRRWDELTGKSRLVTLWAEWCAPCLAEARDFAHLQRRYGGERFEVLAILTSSFRKLDLPQAQAALTKVKAGNLPLWIEPDGGDRLYRSLAHWDRVGKPVLPCTLLVDARGEVRARMFGAPSRTPPVRLKPGEKASAKALSDLQKKALESGQVTTAWAWPEADAFVRALATGAWS